MKKTIASSFLAASFVSLLIASTQTFAAQILVSGATITAVGNTYSNNDVFSIKVAGGTGPCSNMWINFIGGDAKTSGIFNRAYANALLAFATGSTIAVYSDLATNYTCNGSYFSGRATYLELDK